MIDSRIVASDGTNDLVVVGRIGYLVPTIRSEYSPELQAALRRRRTATLTGRCDCGGSTAATMPGRMDLEHEAECPAGDDWIVPRLLAERGAAA